MRRIIASLDIGSNTIKLVVGEFIKNSFHILCVSETQSKGIKKGLILRSEELITPLKETFHKAEEILGISVNEVVLSIPAYDIESFMVEGEITITNEERVIDHKELLKALKESSKNKISSDRELLSIIPTRYKVDGSIVKNPINMIGEKLAIKAAVVTAPKNVVASFVSILDRIGVKIIDVSTTPLGDYTTNRIKDISGEVGAVINIGEETTTVSIFNKGILLKSEVIELGGINIDNDISYVYKITKKDARYLKETIGLAVSDLASDKEKVELTDRLGEKVIISEKDLSEIIESRLEEILELSKKQINMLTKKDINYIILTGGTTEIGDFNILIDKVFTKRHILGKIDSVGVRSNKFSTAIGVLKYYNGKLLLQNKEYSVFKPSELETLSGAHKKVNINENSILGKLFGYFFDS